MRIASLCQVRAGPPPGSCIVPSSEPSNRIFLFSRKHSRSSSHVQRVSYFWIDATPVQIPIDGATLIASREASMANYQPRCLSRTLSPFPYRRYIWIQWACQLPYSICKVRFCEIEGGHNLQIGRPGRALTLLPRLAEIVRTRPRGPTRKPNLSLHRHGTALYEHREVIGAPTGCGCAGGSGKERLLDTLAGSLVFNASQGAMGLAPSTSF